MMQLRSDLIKGYVQENAQPKHLKSKHEDWFHLSNAGALLKQNVTHLDETSHMSAEFVFRYGPKCMGGLILTILVLLHL